MQKEAYRNFAESQGWEIVKEFSEKGVSGFKKSAKDRDEYNGSLVKTTLEEIIVNTF